MAISLAPAPGASPYHCLASIQFPNSLKSLKQRKLAKNCGLTAWHITACHEGYPSRPRWSRARNGHPLIIILWLTWNWNYMGHILVQESGSDLCSLLREPYPDNDSLPLRLSNSAPAFEHDNRPKTRRWPLGRFRSSAGSQGFLVCSHRPDSPSFLPHLKMCTTGSRNSRTVTMLTKLIPNRFQSCRNSFP
ncbi:MAG: hypothetical protein A4E58_02141 [Syntrophorhabdus sp. PtaB.Bin006]|nr:MAG: hypothetical protein A4E58_02141 [Syntrophorhabdus sp. PtaB.Bin006]